MNTTAFKTDSGRDAVISAYETLLLALQSQHDALYVETRFGKAFVLAAGKVDAPVLVLLHGSAMNSLMWVEDMTYYAKYYRVYAVDLQGEPGKSNGLQLPFQGSEFSDWLHDVFVALSIQKASIVGISLGAWLAIKFAIVYPQIIEKLVLLCPGGVGPQRISFVFVALFYSLLGDRGLDLLMRKVNGDKPIPQEVLAYQKLIGKHFNFRREQIPLFSNAELMKLQMPSLLIVGLKDVLFHSLKTAERYQRLVPTGKVVTLPNEGHTLIGLTAEILAFLRGS